MATTQGEAKQSEKKMEKRNDRRPNRRGRGRRPQEEREFDQKIIDLARVTRVSEGGKQMSFRATVAIGDHKGRVGVGLGKGKDVSIAINKAVNRAKKQLVQVPLVDGTIPHETTTKFGASKVMVRPAAHGTGIIAGGIVRIILELSGIDNIVAKMYGSKSKVNNAKATIKALKSLETADSRKKVLA